MSQSNAVRAQSLPATEWQPLCRSTDLVANSGVCLLYTSPSPRD